MLWQCLANIVCPLGINGFEASCMKIPCWLENIKDIIVRKLKYYELWNNQGAINKNKQITNCTNTMRDCYRIQWLNSLYNDNRVETKTGNKLRTNRKYKHLFQMEDYLSNFKEKRNRFMFTRLRCSAHHLQIERGRYNVPKTPVEKRLCKYCNLNEIEGEYHLD